MNSKKRILALLMCICMIFTLLPFSALADNEGNESRGGNSGIEPDSNTGDTKQIVYGQYVNGEWAEVEGLTAEKTYPASDHTSNTGANITYSKTAAKAEGDNTYDITLNVTATAKKTAVVLVMDTSFSAYYCADCGETTVGEHSSGCYYSKHTEEQGDNATYLAAEKAAATGFVNSYAGTVEGMGRYIQLVSFRDKAYAKLDQWVDVSTAEGKAKVLAAISNVEQIDGDYYDTVNGGKDLIQGLNKANELIVSAPTDNKFAIVLTNSKPTQYDGTVSIAKRAADGEYVRDENGSIVYEEVDKIHTDESAVYTGTTNEAGNLRKNCTVYTAFIRDARNFRFDNAINFDKFLENYVATSGCALDNASAQVNGERNRSNWLKKVLSNEYGPNQTDLPLVQLGVTSGFTVTDPMGKYMELLDSSLTDCEINEATANSPKTIVWTPTTGIGTDNNNGSVSITYTLKYTVTVNTALSGFEYDKYYPTNGDTTLSFADGQDYGEYIVGPHRDKDGNIQYRVDGSIWWEKAIGWHDYIVALQFNVPGVWVAEPVADVNYVYVDEQFKIINDENLKAPASETYKVGNDFFVTNEPEATDIPGYTFKGWYLDADTPVKVGKGLEMKANGMTIYGMLAPRTDLECTINCYWNGDKTTPIKPEVVKEGLTYKTEFTTTPPDIEGYTAVSKQPVTITVGLNNEINFYYYKNVEITANSDTVYYDGKEHSVSGFTGAPEGADFSVITVGAKGTKIGDYPAEFVATTVDTVDRTGNYIITKATNGMLTIKSRPVNPGIYTEITVTITGNSDSVVYDGTEHNVKGYTVEISDSRYTEKDFTFSGKDIASGVNAGTYEMGLKSEQFKNTNALFKNVKFVIKADGVLTITPMDLTITAGSKDGIAPVTCNEYENTDLAKGDVIESVKITGEQLEPGQSPNVASDAVIKNAKGEDVTKNYNIKYVDGTLKAVEPLNKEDHFNYIVGYTDGTIRPNNNITRAEVAAIFFRLLTDEARSTFMTDDCSFSDVAQGAWCRRSIATLTNAEIISGYTDGTFKPNAPITRAELATIIARFAKLDVNTKTFSDINGHWAQKYIELAAGNGWIDGYTDGTFRPNQNIKRAETFAMINRVLDRVTESNSDLLPTDQMNMWSDNMDFDAWYYRDVQEATNNHKAERVGDSIYEKWTEKLPDIDWAAIQL